MSQVQQVKDAINIVDVIGSRLTLQRAGANFKGLCPFHSENGPSFFVSETMQRYKCFGCGKSGDVYTFLEEYEGMTFREALESLAETAGITLTAAAPITQEDEERGKLLEVLDLARAYYHYLLTEHAVGAQAREYLKKRGLRQESIKQFQLGVALSAWDGLVAYLHFKKKYPLELIVKAGLASKSENGRVYDKFRSRVMFPLKNHRGQVVGFSGRIYGASKDEKDAPKYMNTPETTLYHKSQLLFGLYENLQTIRKERKVVVVEGEFDVISSVEAHMNTVVAIKGSALTADHVKILSRSVDQIILSLDADEAGIAATRKAIDVVATHQASREVPLTLSVLRIPNGKDPDEFSKSDPKGWRELVKKPSTAYEFLLTAACEKYDPTAAEGKLQIMTELAPVLSKITHAVQYEYYTKFLAERLGATLQSVQNDIKNYQLRDSMKTTKTTASSDSEKQPGQQKKATQSKQQSLESYLFFIACNARPQERAQWLSELQPELLVTPGSKQFLEVFSDPTKEFGEAGKQLPEDLQEVVFELATNPQYYASVETLDLAQEWKNTLKDLKAVQNKQVGQQIEKELEELDRIARKTAAQEARQAELLQQLVLLKRK
jgi:DNA primase